MSSKEETREEIALSLRLLKELEARSGGTSQGFREDLAELRVELEEKLKNK